MMQKNHNYLWILGIISFLFIAGSFKPAGNNSIDPKLFEKANTAKNEAGLSQEEKNVITYINLVRLNPQKFIAFLDFYIDSTKYKENKWVKSLRSDLKKTQAMDVLLPNKELKELAKNHALDMGQSGKYGHDSSKGIKYEDRIKKLKDKFKGLGENCNYGYSKGMAVVMGLLIDEGVDNLGHRKNILEPSYKYIGASIEPHKGMRFNAVIEMAGDLK